MAATIIPHSHQDNNGVFFDTIAAPLNGKAINAPLLMAQLIAAFPAPSIVNPIVAGDGSTAVEVYVVPPATQVQADQLDSVIAAHDPNVLTPDQTAANQAQASADLILPMLAIARTLPAAEQPYVVMGRILAMQNGAAANVINGIVDKATATVYLQSTPRWVALPAVTKAWEGDMLNMIAGVLQLLIVRLH